MLQRCLALFAVAALAGACGASSTNDAASEDSAAEQAFVECDNGIVVYQGTDCQVVSFDADELPEALQDQIDELKAEAEADPSRAMANVQKIQLLIAAQPFQVCDAMQNDPDGVFLTTDNIAPVAESLDESVCPSAATLATVNG